MLSNPFKSRRRPPEKLPPLNARIERANARVAELKAVKTTTAAAWAEGGEGSADKLRAINKELAELAEELDWLSEARIEAEAHDQELYRLHREASRQAAVRKVKVHLDGRDAAGARLQAAIANAVSAYREMILESREAQRLCPPDASWPNGAGLCGSGELHMATDQELFRQGHRVDADRLPSFPRQREFLLHPPSQLKPLGARLARQSEIVLAQLGGKSVSIDPGSAAEIEAMKVAMVVGSAPSSAVPESSAPSSSSSLPTDDPAFLDAREAMRRALSARPAVAPAAVEPAVEPEPAAPIVEPELAARVIAEAKAETAERASQPPAIARAGVKALGMRAKR